MLAEMSADLNGSDKAAEAEIVDLRDHAPRYVGAAFKTLAGRSVSVNILAANYDPPKPNNLRQLKKDMGEHDAHDLKIHLITDVLEYAHSDGYSYADAGMAFRYDDAAADEWSLADGVDIAAVTYEDQLLIRKPVLPDLFDPAFGRLRSLSVLSTPM